VLLTDATISVVWDPGNIVLRAEVTTSTGTPRYYGAFPTSDGNTNGNALDELVAWVRPNAPQSVFGVIEVRRFDPTGAAVFTPDRYEVAPMNAGDAYGQAWFTTWMGMFGIAAYSRNTGRYQFHAWIDASTGFDPAVTHVY
jgi:hypothetical protein